MEKPIQRIAIIGTGVIGASWSALYLARGPEVIATDPAPNAEANLPHYIETAWPELEALGLSPNASLKHPEFTTDLKSAVSKADFVQENGPVRPDFKIKLFADGMFRTGYIGYQDSFRYQLAKSGSGKILKRILRDRFWVNQDALLLTDYEPWPVISTGHMS